jgi:hypothetical protein
MTAVPAAAMMKNAYHDSPSSQVAKAMNGR